MKWISTFLYILQLKYTMNLKRVLISQFEVFHFLKLIIVGIIYCATTYYGYAIFSMLFFGESATSFMYTKMNSFIYIGLIIIPPTIFNLNQFFKNYKTGFYSKAKSYITSEGILVILFVWIYFETGLL